MAFARIAPGPVISLLAVLWTGGALASGDDLASIRLDLQQALPRESLAQLLSSPPLVFRSVPPRGSVIYRERVGGVVLIASTNAVGTGVLVSDQGDIVTNDHIVQASHRARGHEWIAVWFKPPSGVRPVPEDFLLARVLQRDSRRDLAHLRLVQSLPRVATAVPLAVTLPDVGQEVFTIGHPKRYLWSLTQAVVSQIREDYQWQYEDGLPRTATAIQIQAPVNPGSSGGPLLNERGEMVGIVIGTAPQTHGVSFAVSVRHVRELLPGP
jgi:S1-C subfamily serine protease